MYANALRSACRTTQYNYSLSEAGSTGVVQSVNGVEQASGSQSGNALTGASTTSQTAQGYYQRTTTTAGGTSIDTGSTDATLQQSGNALMGNQTQTLLGTDRYSLLDQFTNASTGAGGRAT